MTSGLVHNLDSAHAGLRKDGDGPVKITPAGIDGAPSLTFTYADDTQIVCATRLEQGKHFVPEGWDVKTPIVNFGVLFVGDKGWIHVERHGLLTVIPKTSWTTDIRRSIRSKETTATGSTASARGAGQERMSRSVRVRRSSPIWGASPCGPADH